jgi:triacylglycerol esterase/lipase EstA (alpha/beta hydrolase family)
MRPFFLAVLLLAVPLWAPAGAQSEATTQERELVVVLHGMGRTSYSMAPMKEALEEAGFDVLNLGYSSYCCSIAELGAIIREQIATGRGAHVRVHFVGHSLGGIIARWILTQPTPPPGVGRVVMLAPPNQGSKSADFYSPVAGWLLEPMDELRTDASSTVCRLPEIRGFEVGVIAALDDGKVQVTETHVAGEHAHVVVEGNHTFIMRRDDVHRLTIQFLREGRFDAPTPAPRAR